MPYFVSEPLNPQVGDEGVPSKPDGGAGSAKGSGSNSKLDARLKNLCKNGRLSEAMASYSIVKCGSTVRPNTLSHLIHSCIDSNSLDLCYKLHGYVRKLREESDPFVETKLVSMYAKCGSLENAFEVFDAMSESEEFVRMVCDNWGLLEEEEVGEVKELVYSMMESDNIVPDDFLFPKILQACGNCGDLETGRLIHGLVTKCRMNSLSDSPVQI
ncbi:Hypothetical predicted protein [Olea europaea subsp. europaea]|uniref:Pentatricopeptide repeat-containing protein n=1 Tax=Olea europaea subsp. europaea TaxID=158383 RepID=A0A8S0SP80_OLEEU|nr:Hypothetical predicted protein [Olea europaea subsp. europaea]